LPSFIFVDPPTTYVVPFQYKYSPKLAPGGKDPPPPPFIATAITLDCTTAPFLVESLLLFETTIFLLFKYNKKIIHNK